MNYTKKEFEIEIFDTEFFNVKKTLECGQVFRFFERDNKYVIISTNKIAELEQFENKIIIKTRDVNYFENYFDLLTNYQRINKNLMGKNDFLNSAIEFGKGIRILKQDKFETLISFIISANNNIKRIKNSLNEIAKRFGTKINFEYYAFPTLKQLKSATIEDFVECGLGYRSKQLFNAINQLINGYNLEKLALLPTKELETKLVELSGVGPKVADCVAQFAYERQNAFIVDTWVEKAFNAMYGSKNHNRIKIRDELVEKFGNLSGYVQQYLFYYKRTIK